MIITKNIKEMREREIITYAYCDFCYKRFKKKTFECNGFGKIHFSFGYGSCFDDDSFDLEICDKCFINKFALMIKKKEIKNKEWSLYWHLWNDIFQDLKITNKKLLVYLKKVPEKDKRLFKKIWRKYE